MVWGGMGWNAMAWDDMGRDKTGWGVMGWDGMGWDGMGWNTYGKIFISFDLCVARTRTDGDGVREREKIPRGVRSSQSRETACLGTRLTSEKNDVSQSIPTRTTDNTITRTSGDLTLKSTINPSTIKDKTKIYVLNNNTNINSVINKFEPKT